MKFHLMYVVPIRKSRWEEVSKKNFHLVYVVAIRKSRWTPKKIERARLSLLAWGRDINGLECVRD